MDRLIAKARKLARGRTATIGRRVTSSGAVLEVRLGAASAGILADGSRWEPIFSFR